jgi:hypothetical protein
MAGGFRSALPLPFSVGGGTIVPFSPLSSSPIRSRTVISGLDIRGETQRLRVDSPNNKTVKDIRFILAKSLDALQANADIQDDRFRQLATNLNSLGITKDPSGNVVFSCATFSIRAGTEQFSLALGGMLFGLPATPVEDDSIPRNHGSMYLDEAGNSLKVRVRYSDGTLKTATIALV